MAPNETKSNKLMNVNDHNLILYQEMRKLAQFRKSSNHTSASNTNIEKNFLKVIVTRPSLVTTHTCTMAACDFE